MKNLILAAGILLATVVSAIGQSDEIRNLRDFSELKVSQSIRVTLVKGNKNEAIITTSGVDTDKVVTNIEGSMLRIEMQKGSYRSTNVRVQLTYNGNLSKISISSSASVTGTDEITSESLTISGSSSSSAKLSLNVRELDVKVSSSSTVRLSGKAKYQDIAISSSGDLLAFNLDGEDADVRVSSSGKAEINIHGKLDAKASSSGKVIYKGNPEKVFVDTSSSGRVIED